MEWLTTTLGANQTTGTGGLADLWSNAPLVLGAILIGFVLLVPKGLVPTLADGARRLLRPRPRAPAAAAAPEGAE